MHANRSIAPKNPERWVNRREFFKEKGRKKKKRPEKSDRDKKHLTKEEIHGNIKRLCLEPDSLPFSFYLFKIAHLPGESKRKMPKN